MSSYVNLGWWTIRKVRFLKNYPIFWVYLVGDHSSRSHSPNVKMMFAADRCMYIYFSQNNLWVFYFTLCSFMKTLNYGKDESFYLKRSINIFVIFTVLTFFRT